MSPVAPTVAAARAALKEVEGAAAALEVFSTEHEGPRELPRVGERRRRRRAGEPDPVATVSLVLNADGVLLWQEGAPPPSAPGRRRGGAGAAPEGELVELYQFERLEPNEINRYLVDLDRTLNPDSGLSRLSLTGRAGAQATLARAAPSDPPRGKQRRLLIVHGTFSRSEALLAGIARAPNGQSFLRRVFARYDQVLAFDHPTLAPSPVLNGFDLSRLMAGATGPLDVVAHSRGGLVTRWFLEGFGAARGQGPYRAVLVGAPLGGTSLAAPPRLRDALSVLTNIGAALRASGAARLLYLPLLAAPLGLLKVASSVVSLAGRIPIIDAAVAMIPGLAGQSRVKLNPELDRVRALALDRPPTYFVVRSNFETDDPGWRFWRWFRVDMLAHAGAERIFPGENDLVVDTRSMSELDPPPPRHDFGTSPTVHHTNYFEQPDTLDFVLESLGVP